MSDTLSRSSTAAEALTASYWIRIGKLLFEKCELLEAKKSFLRAYECAQASSDAKSRTEDKLDALIALLRYSAEAQDTASVEKYEREILKTCGESNAGRVPAKFWYCRSVVHDLREEPELSRKEALQYLKTLKAEVGEPKSDTELQNMIRGYLLLAKALYALGHERRAERVCRTILEHFEVRKLKSVNGNVSLQLAKIYANRKDLRTAIAYIQKAHAAFLEEHDWYSHLYVLLWYARVARLQQNFSQAFWYLDLLEKATPNEEFSILRDLIEREKETLNDDKADIVIDSFKGVLKTRDGSEVSLGKQYVLLDILRALSDAYNSSSAAAHEKGLTKAEIIQKVWREKYRPEAHDNKLYYNINRLRKLIEPDLKRPKYLLNWKEGYRFAPGLKVQLLGDPKNGRSSNSEKH